MKNKRIIYIAIIIVILLSTVDVFAYKRRKDYFIKPQIGGWFGPITPIGKTSKLVDTNLGGGIFLRYNSPFRFLKFGVDSSYQKFKSKGVNELQFVPLYGSLIYLLPIDLPVRFQLKGGAGGGYLYVKPDKIGQWDPIFTAGVEVSFPAGRIVNIGLRLDYIYIYEGYIKGSKNGGHIFNTGIMLYFNIR